MPLKFIEIRESGSKLSLKRGSLSIKLGDDEHLITLENISVIIFTGYGQLISTNLINELISKGCIITFCDKKFMPSSFILPYAGHHMIKGRVEKQISLSQPTKKNIWKEIVKTKIHMQGMSLSNVYNDDDGLIAFSKNVKSGDSENFEAQAAKRYWPKFFGDGFYRSDEENLLNSYLNYGYMVLRSTMARNVVKVGLSSMFGVYHKNESNAFCLIDDLMEPLRPFIDLAVYSFQKNNLDDEELTREFKKVMTSIVNIKVYYENEYISLDSVCYDICMRFYKSTLDEKFDLVELRKISLNEYIECL